MGKAVQRVKPDAMICGHVHDAYITRPGDALDRLGQPCPVVVGSAPGSKIYHEPVDLWVEGVFVGAGFEANKDGIAVAFVGSDGVTHRNYKI